MTRAGNSHQNQSPVAPATPAAPATTAPLVALSNLLFDGELAYAAGQPVTAEAAERNGWTDQVGPVKSPAPTPGTPTTNQEA